MLARASDVSAAPQAIILWTDYLHSLGVRTSTLNTRRDGNECDFSRDVVGMKQVCVEPRPSARNMTLPAFAAERERRVPAVDRYPLQAPAISSKPAARREGTDRQTDGHPTVT